TAASKMTGKISPEVIKQRKKILSEIDNQLHMEWLHSAVGQKPGRVGQSDPGLRNLEPRTGKHVG
ncbi:MAG: hypothetical protein ABJB95_01610, partial [Gemmatimonadales bacterium]